MKALLRSVRRPQWALLPLLSVVLWGQPPATPRAVVETTFGADLPFDLLPQDRNGNILSIERARAEVKTARNVAVRESMNAFFPPQSRQSNPEWWRQTTDSQGRVHTIPNETHPRYAEFTGALDRRYDHIDQDYRTRYGDRYEAFSRAIFDNPPDGVSLIGRAQENLFSDVDATFRDPAQRRAIVDSLAAKGFTIEEAPGEHGLYVRVKELDWVQWSNNTVEDLQRQWDAAEHNPAQREEIGRRLQAAMNDAEVCATTVGARYALCVPGGSEDPVGSTLDHLKKFAQSDDLETKSKVVCKIGPGDDSPTAQIRRQNQGLPQAGALLRDYAGDKRALRMEHLPLALQEDRRVEHRLLLENEAVDSYRRAALESQLADRATDQMRDCMVRELDEHQRRGDVVAQTTMKNAIAALDEQQRQKRRENNQTMREISRADPNLYRRLVGAHGEVLQNVARLDPDSRQVRDQTAPRTAVRDGWMSRDNLQRYGAVVVDTATRLSDQTGAVFDRVGQIGGYAAIADEAFIRAAAGDGDVTEIIAEGVAKDMAMDRLTQKFPKLGSMMQVINVPTMMVAEMESEMDRAEARNGSITMAKSRAVWNVMKKQTFIGTFEKILNEEGMAEVQNELANGTYSWGGVAYRTAVSTVGEVTQMNAALRFGANSYYNVYELEKNARLEEDKLRNKLRAKSLGSDASLEALSREIIRLQLDPNVDDEIIQERITALQAQFDSGVQGMREMGKRYRAKYGVDDPQVNDLYRRSQVAIERQNGMLLEAKLTRLAYGNDPLKVETWNELNKLREEYRQEVEKTKAKAKFLIEHSGVNDPLTQEVLARARRMRDTSIQLEEVKFDINDQRQRENDAERTRREQELQSFADAFKQQAKRLPPHIRSDDYALVIELDDLIMHQNRGEIPLDADLIGLAIEGVDRDYRYNQLLRQQTAGEIPEDADLLELLDGPSEAAGGADNVDTGAVADNDPAEDVTDEPFDPLAENSGDTPVFYGFDGRDLPFDAFPYISAETEGLPPIQSAQPVVNGRSQGVHQRKDSSGRILTEISYLNGQLHGPNRAFDNATFALTREQFFRHDEPHGPKREFRNGQLYREAFFAAGKAHGPSREFHPNGQLARESFQRAGVLHGPAREFFEDGTLKRERWIQDGLLHGWEREWNADGRLISEAFGTQLGDRTAYYIKRAYARDTGALVEETYQDLSQPVAVGSSLKFPTLKRTFMSDGKLRTELRTMPDGKRFGLNIVVGQDGVRTEEQYQPAGQRRSLERSDESTGNLLETAEFTTSDEGRELPHGPYLIHFPVDSPLAGKPMVTAHYRNGLLHGEFLALDAQGEVRQRGRFNDGRPDGPWQEFENGDPSKDLNFREGALEGVQHDYVSDRSTQRYRLDKIIEINGGRVTRFTINQAAGLPLEMHGETTLEIVPVEPLIIPPQSKPAVYLKPPWPFDVNALKNARMITGTVKESFIATDNRGNPVEERVQREETYRDSILDGSRRLYFRNGKPFLHESIRQGLLNGACKAWFQNGDLAAEVSFVNGFKHGTFRYRERPGYPEVEVQCDRGAVVGWTTTYQMGGKLYSRVFQLFPAQPNSAVSGSRPFAGNPGSYAEQAPEWGRHPERSSDWAGPRIFYASNGAVSSADYFAFDAKGERRSTKDVNEYLEWAAADSRLPTTVPGDGPLKATRKLNLPANARIAVSSGAGIITESSVPAPKRGLNREAAHEQIMAYWTAVNQHTTAKEFSEAEKLAVTAARFARAYSQNEARAVPISYEKAASAAEYAGNRANAVAYLEQAINAARELGQSDMIPDLEKHRANLR